MISWLLLIQCGGKEFPFVRLFVVIDHNAALLERAQKALPDVVVAQNTGTPGTSEAWNSGIAIASGQAIAFLDDDIVAKPDWSLSLQEPLKNPRTLGIGGSVTPNWPEKRPSWFPEEFYWVVGCTYRGMPQTTAAIRNPIGSNMVFRREVFEGIGVFRRELGPVGASLMRCDETELCIRAHQRWPQGSFLYEPEANVSHHVPAGRATWRYFCARCYAEGLSKAVMTRFVG
jgi:Predicted glycosyltransferases